MTYGRAYTLLDSHHTDKVMVQATDTTGVTLAVYVYSTRELEALRAGGYRMTLIGDGP